jgi:hypothetical protein
VEKTIERVLFFLASVVAASVTALVAVKVFGKKLRKHN